MWIALLAVYIVVPVVMIGNPARIAERPIPLFLWKVKYSDIEISNPEAEDWEMTSSVRWSYPFASFEGPITDFKAKKVDTDFQWFMFGYLNFAGSVFCDEEVCRLLNFTNRDLNWFANTITLIPNKYPVKKLVGRGHNWVINREDGAVQPFRNSPEDSLYVGGIQGRDENSDLVIEGVNGGRLFLVEGVNSAHDADWGDGREVSEIRIPKFERRSGLYVIYFLERYGSVFKCTLSGRTVTTESTTLFGSVVNLGDGMVSTTQESTEGLSSLKYLRGYINGKPIY